MDRCRYAAPWSRFLCAEVCRILPRTLTAVVTELFLAGDKKAAEKTSQALREKAIEEREKIKSEPGAVGILVPTPASYLDATTANVIGNILASGTFKGTEGENVVTAAAAATTTTTAAAAAAATTTATTTTAVEKEEQGTTDAPEAAAPEAKDAEKNEAGAIANEAPAVIAQVEV